MDQGLVIQWREEVPHLYAAQLVDAEGVAFYVGYVAEGPGSDVWRGYLGPMFTPVGMGPRKSVQQAIEQRALEVRRQRAIPRGEAIERRGG